MKLVELLAREWSEWPGNCDYAVCDSDGEIRAIGTGTNNDFYPATAVDLEDRLNGTALLVSDDGKRVTRSDWAAERARIAKPSRKADKDGWIRHRGGKAPVADGVLVDVRNRSGDVCTGRVDCDSVSWHWSHDQHGGDIMAYRLHKPAEQVDDKADMKAAAYDAIQPLQWRDRIAEIDVEVQARTAERAELVQKLASEGFALIGRINDMLTDAAHKHEDMSDWRNWKTGDQVEITGETEGHEFETGDIVTIEDATGSDECRFKCVDRDDWWWVSETECKFHSRPSA